MKTPEFEQKYKALQEEAKAIASELKPLAKRYKSLCKKALTLGYKADNDDHLYTKVPITNILLGNTDETDTDGWNIHVLFRLTDFDDEASFFLQDAYVLLMNLKDEPFHKQTRKHTK